MLIGDLRAGIVSWLVGLVLSTFAVGYIAYLSNLWSVLLIYLINLWLLLKELSLQQTPIWVLLVSVLLLLVYVHLKTAKLYSLIHQSVIDPNKANDIDKQKEKPPTQYIGGGSKS